MIQRSLNEWLYVIGCWLQKGIFFASRPSEGFRMFCGLTDNTTEQTATE